MTDQSKLKHYQNNTKWNQKNTTYVGLRFSKEKDKDILEFLFTKPNRVEYVRQLIRQDMEQQKKDGEA